MLNNNFKKLVKGMLGGRPSGGYFNFEDMTDVDNYADTFCRTSTSNPADFITNFGACTFKDLYDGGSSADSSIFVGTGQRGENSEDIALESIVPDSDLQMNSAQATRSEGKLLFTKTFTYVGISDINITEVAYYKRISFYNRPKKIYTFCFARQLIDPISVKTGDVFTVTMVIG